MSKLTDRAPVRAIVTRMKAKEIIERLNNIPMDESHRFVAAIYDALRDVRQVDDPKNFFPLAFKYMRERDTADFGTPGPLSNFIEKCFPEYVGDLAESLKVKVTEPTLFLARRIFNSALLTKDEGAIQALPTLAKALQFAKEHLELEPYDIQEIDEILSSAR
jgi:hypothetical protein